MILSALIFSQLVVLLALLHLVRRSLGRENWTLQKLVAAVKRWAYRTFTYDPFPPRYDDPMGNARHMTDKDREFWGHRPVKGRWYQRPRYKV
jgi:hypothetical protein